MNLLGPICKWDIVLVEGQVWCLNFNPICWKKKPMFPGGTISGFFFCTIMLPVIASEEFECLTKGNYFIHRLIISWRLLAGPFRILSTLRWPTIASARAWVGRSRPHCCTRHMQPASDSRIGIGMGKKHLRNFRLWSFKAAWQWKIPPHTSAFRVHFPTSYVKRGPTVVGGLADLCVEVPTVARDIIYGWARGLVGTFFQDLFAPEEFTHKARRAMLTQAIFTAPSIWQDLGFGKIPVWVRGYLSLALWFFMSCPHMLRNDF